MCVWSEKRVTGLRPRSGHNLPGCISTRLQVLRPLRLLRLNPARWNETFHIAQLDTPRPMIDPQKVKADSIATLRSWGVPVIDHLPQLEAEAHLSPQSAVNVARRCMILSHVIGIGFGGNAEELREAAEVPSDT